MYARRWSWVVVCVGAMSLAGPVCGRVHVIGEISFDLKVPDKRSQGQGALAVSRASSDNRDVTRAVPLECTYQYPEPQQVDAMLSNMMNQLTKMFVRLNNYMRSESRREDKRFKIVQDSAYDFFDNIYFNMTEEYRNFVNHTRSRVDGVARGDPCEHQSEIREVWRALLDSSRESVRRAALACVEEYLRVAARTGGGEDGEAVRGRARSRASQLLRRELARVRRDQLALLCDSFQLCFNELL